MEQTEARAFRRVPHDDRPHDVADAVEHFSVGDDAAPVDEMAALGHRPDPVDVLLDPDHREAGAGIIDLS